MPVENKHAMLGASNSQRWLYMPPIARLEAAIPEKGSSVFALEGTKAHELAELKLQRETGKISEKEYFKQHRRFRENSDFYNAEMEEETDKYVAQVMQAYNAHENAEIFLEQKVDFSGWVPGGFGTADVAIVSDDTLEVIDLKYGKGIPVSAYQNTQAMLYALGTYAELDMVYDFEWVKMTIIQPRLNNNTTFEVHVDELLYWADNYVAPRAQQADLGIGQYEFKPGILRFSPVKAQLKERARQNIEFVERYENRGGELLTKEELEYVLGYIDEVEAWVKDVKDFALKEVRDKGEKLEGFKLVEGRSRRVISDPGKVEELLLDSGYDDEVIFKPREMNPLTKLEKALGKSRFNELVGPLVTKEPGKLTLVPEDDRRPEATPYTAARDEFSEDFDEND